MQGSAMESWIVTVLVANGTVAFLVIAALVLIWKWRKSGGKSRNDPTLLENNLGAGLHHAKRSLFSENNERRAEEKKKRSFLKKYDLSTLHLERLMEPVGRFTTEYKGIFTDFPHQPVAVKVFDREQKLKWHKERDIFETISLSNSTSLQFFYGAHESVSINEHTMVRPCKMNET